MRPCWPRSIRSPGRSTCAARTSITRPVALSFALVHDDGTADLFVASEKVGDDVRQHLGNGVRLHERDEFERALAGARRQDRRGRSGALGRGDLRGAGQGRRPYRRPARPLDPAQGDQERGRDRRPPGRAGARRRRALALPALALGRGAEGRRRRARGRREAAGLPPGGRRPSRPELRHHLRRRPQWRDRPLPGERGDQPPARDGSDLPGRFGRPISGRHHRRDPHRDRRHADGGDEGPLHPRAQGPYRARPRALPGGDARLAARQLRAAVSCGRRGSITPTAPATASAPSSRCTKGRSASRRSAAPSRAATSRSRPA